jgi:hypothetical protein
VLVALLVNLELRRLLHDVVARARDLDGWVAGLGVLGDGVAALGLDLGLAGFFDLGDFAARARAGPLPGDWRGEESSAVRLEDHGRCECAAACDVVRAEHD